MCMRRHSNVFALTKWFYSTSLMCGDRAQCEYSKSVYNTIVADPGRARTRKPVYTLLLCTHSHTDTGTHVTCLRLNISILVDRVWRAAWMRMCVCAWHMKSDWCSTSAASVSVYVCVCMSVSVSACICVCISYKHMMMFSYRLTDFVLHSLAR